MAKVTRPCPKCQFPLAIPQPTPERFMCPKCGVIMKRKSAAPAAASVPAPAPVAATAAIQAGPPRTAPTAAVVANQPAGMTPKRQLLILGGFLTFLLGSIGVVLVLLIGGNRGEEGKPGDTSSPDASSAAAAAGTGNPAEPGGTATHSAKPSTPARQPAPDDSISVRPTTDDGRWLAVKPSFEKGVAFLVKQVGAKRKEQKDSEVPLILWGADWERGDGLTSKPWGVMALLGLTLLECGMPGDDPDILWLAENIQANADDFKQTHSTAAAVLFLCRWHESKPLEAGPGRLLKTLALRLIAGQLEHGAWWTDVPLLNAAQEKQLLKELADGKYKPTRRGPGTAAHTSFAVQALWSARKHDVQVRPSLVAAAGHFQRTQLDNGSWAFSEAVNDRFFASSTCAGLIALAAEKAILEKDTRPFVPSEKTADPAAALAFLARSIGDNGDKASFEDRDTIAGRLFMADAWGDVFFLWAVERVALIYDRETIGGKDWYGWGTKALQTAQNEDGSWNDRHGFLVDTCFALMFLKKANFSSDLTAKLKELR